MNANPFWSAGIKTDDGFTIVIDEPINLIHIESTNANGQIHIVRVGIDWPDIEPSEPEDTSEDEIADVNTATEDESISLPLLAIVGIIVAYIMIIFSIDKKKDFSLHFEEE